MDTATEILTGSGMEIVDSEMKKRYADEMPYISQIFIIKYTDLPSHV